MSHIDDEMGSEPAKSEPGRVNLRFATSQVAMPDRMLKHGGASMKPVVLGSALHSVCLTLFLSFPLTGVQDQVGIIGDVHNGPGVPLEQVQVFLNGQLAALTDAQGFFQIVGVSFGRQVVTLMGVGFTRRDFELDIPVGQSGEVDLGSILLTAVPVRTASIALSAVSAQSGAPVPNAPVAINGEVVGLTRSDGLLRLDLAVSDGQQNWISIRRIGYSPYQDVFAVLGSDSAIQVNARLEPLAVELAEIVVSAQHTMYVPARLTGFYRRRSIGSGYFFTQDQIDSSGAVETTQLLRRIPGVQVSEVGLGGKRVRSLRGGQRCGDMLFYLDGVRVNPSRQQEIDYMTDPRRLAGIEVFTGSAQIPIEYNPTGASCGVVLLWTR